VNRKITDAGVASLPLSEGRAELLEEIMATTPLETVAPTGATPPPRRSRWLPVAGAAAAVAVVAAGAFWLGGQQGDEPSKDRGLEVGTTSGDGDVAVLDAPDWRLEDASVDEYGGELEYHSTCRSIVCGGWELTVKWTPTTPFDLYAEDTMDIDGEQVGQRLDVLGRRALLFRYSDDDHLAVVEVLDENLLEIRGEGMDEAAFRDLLTQLEPAPADDLDSVLPERFISDEERPGVIAEMLAPLPLPDGFEPDIDSRELQRYDLGADVATAVVCEWVDRFVAAKRSEDDDAAEEAQEAQDALATSRDWPVLQEMALEGDFPSVVWEIAGDVDAGRFPEGYRQGLGCE
jgi:hypothetical protein